MTAFLLILMALTLIAALERTNRRQLAGPRSLNGSQLADDRDWARIQLELRTLAAGRPGWIISR